MNVGFAQQTMAWIFGFLLSCVAHLHSAQRITLDGKTYSPELVVKDTLAWVRAHATQPFFLYAAWTLPHGKYEIDDTGRYATEDWTPQQKTYAAMVTRLDRDVGRLLALLEELRLQDNTIVFFAGDNGAAFSPDSPNGKFFDQAHGLRGFKRGMYEGGLRQAALVRWPKRVPAGRVSHEPWAFWDFLPTAAELAAAPLPAALKPDGHSILSLLTGGSAPARDYFYWELHEPRFSQAIRFGDWKAVRNGATGPFELYNLATDPGETNNIAAAHADLAARAAALINGARVDDPNWPLQKAARHR